MIASPFAPIFAPHADAIPQAFRDQFLLAPEDPYGVTLEGRMNVWHRPRWLAPLFWLLNKLRLFVAQTGRDVRTTVVITATRDAAGAPPARFNTATVYDAQRDQLVDLTGPGDRLHMASRAQFEPPATLRTTSDAFALQFGARVVWLPRAIGRLLFGDARFVQRADDGDPQIVHVELVMTHPLLGPLFGYNGTFRVARAAKATSG